MTRAVILGIAAIIVLDTAGSVAAALLGFEYTLLIPLSAAIYTATGFAAARSAGRRAAWQAGIVLGAIDATVGWGISWWIGPGRLPPDALGGPVGIAVGMLTAAAVAVLFAGLGGWLATRGRTANPAV